MDSSNTASPEELFAKYAQQYIATGAQDDAFEISISEKKLRHFVQRVCNAIVRNEKIFIFGDYDVDGIGSTAMLHEMINDVALHINRGVDIAYKIPSREDSYGINFEYFEYYLEECDLVITLDNGTHEGFFGKIEESQRSRVLIVDHHPNGDFEEHDFVINPNPNGNVGISTGVILQKIFMAFRALVPGYKEIRDPGHFADLATMTAISDVANTNNPYVRNLIGEGLKRIMERNRYVFKKIIPDHKKDLTMNDVAFDVVPVINSIGRLSADPSWAVELLLAKNYTGRNNDLLMRALDTNEQRKELTSFYTKQTLAALPENAAESTLLYIHDDAVNIGLNGLIAGNIFSAVGVDTIATSFNVSDPDNPIVGSGRGERVRRHLEALATMTSSFSFGGHDRAVGVRIHDQEAFRKAVNDYNEMQMSLSINRMGEDCSTKKAPFIDKVFTLREFLKMCYAYSDIVGKGSIRFKDAIYATVAATTIGMKEYRNNYAKAIMVDDDGFTVSFLISKEDHVDYANETTYLASVVPLKRGAVDPDVDTIPVTITAVKEALPPPSIATTPNNPNKMKVHA